MTILQDSPEYVIKQHNQSIKTYKSTLLRTLMPGNPTCNFTRLQFNNFAMDDRIKCNMIETGFGRLNTSV